MNHPNHEDWIPYLDRVATPETRRTLSDHLKICPECAGRVSAWQRAIHALERLDPPARPVPARAGGGGPAPWWSLAAASFLAVGFVLGLLVSRRPSGPDPAAMAVLRGQLRAEMLAGQRLTREAVLRDVQSGRGEDRRVLIALYDRLEQQRLGDYVSLRRDLETLAATADADLSQTHRQLVSLEVAATQSGEKP